MKEVLGGNMIETKEKKVSLNIKISESLNERLKQARIDARQQNKKFNVSQLVSDFLENKLELFYQGSIHLKDQNQLILSDETMQSLINDVKKAINVSLKK